MTIHFVFTKHGITVVDMQMGKFTPSTNHSAPFNKRLSCWLGRNRLIITRAVRHLAIATFGNGPWQRLPSCLIGK